MRNGKKLLSLLLCLCLLGSLCLPVLAEEQETESEAPQPVILEIQTAEEFLTFAENCRLDSYSRNLEVYLKADIDLSGMDFSGIPTFSGCFEGGGHTVSGLNIQAEGSVLGLFRYVQPGAVVRGLTVLGHVAPAGSAASAGGIAGQMEPVTNITYSEDTLQILQEQAGTLQALTTRAATNAQSNTNKVTGQIATLRDQVETVQDSVDILIPDPEDPQLPDPDSIQAAQNNITESLSAMPDTLTRLTNSVQGTVGTLAKDLQAISNQVGTISATVSSASENLGASLTDVSDADTPELLTGKVENCCNHGAVLAEKPEDLRLLLYLADGSWQEAAFTQDESYMVFAVPENARGFCFVKLAPDAMPLIAAGAGLAVLLAVVLICRGRKKRAPKK